MIRRVTGRGDRDYVPGMGQSPAARERPKRFRYESSGAGSNHEGQR